MYTYIYIYIEREREIESQTDDARDTKLTGVFRDSRFRGPLIISLHILIWSYLYKHFSR